MPDIQLFACPACSKLHKRKVDTWVDLRYPRPPSSPPVDVPRICVCGRVFLLSESTVVANLPGSRRTNPDALREDGMDRMEIPAFLRKREDDDDQRPTHQKKTSTHKGAQETRKGLISRLLETLAARFKKPQKNTKKDLVKSVLRDMEAIALPERIAPKGAVPNATALSAQSNKPPTQ